MYTDSSEFFWFSYISSAGFFLVVTLSNFIYTYVNEKEEKMVETYRIMGMKNLSYQLSWHIILYVKCFILGALLVGIGLTQFQFMFQDGGQLMAVALFSVYIIQMIHQAFLYCVFFSKAKLSSALYTLIFVLTQNLFYAEQNSKKYRYVNILLSAFPQFGLTAGLRQRRKVVGYNEDEEIDKTDLEPENYILYMAAYAFLYLILYLYLSQVVPNDYGTQKHPLFFLKCSSKRKIQRVGSQCRDLESGNKDHDFSSAIYHEEFQNLNKNKKSVEIRNLGKSFGIIHKFKAVDDVSLCLYEKQIFCLLGHNGAGKTTTINLLTGMLTKTTGKVYMYKDDLDHDLEHIRTYVGICGQKDVLFENLTIEEHLLFMCQMKNIPDNKIKHEVDRTVEYCGLANEKGKYAQNLSGGNKRKLSLAIALVGNSKVLFLDEPSSGLDPQSRRKIWDILKKVKGEDRSIILTTHHLEEAEELSERIGIMAKGRLLTLGTSDFIKKKFGIGFHLEIILEKKQQNQEEEAYKKLETIDQKIREIEKEVALTQEEDIQIKLNNIVFKHIERVKIDPQSHKHVIKYILPYDQRSNFTQLFKELEQVPNISLNLELNSLEEAFVNIGMDEQKLLQNIEQSNHHNQKQVLNTQQQHQQLPQNKLPVQQYNMQQQPMLHQQKQQQQANFSDFSDIQAPECLKRPPTYSFSQQLKSIYLRKLYVTVRTGSYMLGYILPIFLIILALVLSNQFALHKRTTILDQNGQKSTHKFDPYIPNIESQTTFVTLGLTFSFLLAMYTFPIQIVHEKEVRLKYSMYVMGCKVGPYWLGNFLFDLTYLVFYITVFIITGSLLPNVPLIKNAIVGWVFTLLPAGICLICYSYFLSFRYQTQGAIQKYFFWFLFFVFYLIPILLISPVGENDNKTKHYTLHIYFQIFSPVFELNNACSCVVDVYRQQIQGDDIKLSNGEMWYARDHYPNYNKPFQNVYLYVISFLLQALVAFYITIRKDIKEADLTQQQVTAKIENETVKQEPEVLEEQKRLLQPDCKDLVKVVRLSKQYPNGFTAIKDNNFGVKEGEIFGLLGPNGAGKSTTFNIITSSIPKTSGSFKLKEKEITSGIDDVYQDVGICAQVDTLWDTLTVYQHLKLYATLKGLQGKDLHDSIEYYIKVMQLETYRNRQSGQLSGGNKRKLCVTLALIGGPCMQFFDEPSSGVDPIARRFLWNSLQQNLKTRNSAITITTHSMIEAESLCHKIGILVNGRMYCYGTPEFLKKKYGEGYMITLFVNSTQRGEAEALFMEKFTNAQRQISDEDKKDQDQQQGDDQLRTISIGYKLPYENFSFYQTFQFCEDLVAKKVVKDFSVTQSSLEQIFIQFSKIQNSNQGAEIK